MDRIEGGLASKVQANCSRFAPQAPLDGNRNDLTSAREGFQLGRKTSKSTGRIVTSSRRTRQQNKEQECLKPMAIAGWRGATS
jgi:hypothetical protein